MARTPGPPGLAFERVYDHEMGYPITLPGDLHAWLVAKARAQYGGDVAACVLDALYEVKRYDDEDAGPAAQAAAVEADAGGIWADLETEVSTRGQ